MRKPKNRSAISDSIWLKVALLLVSVGIASAICGIAVYAAINKANTLLSTQLALVGDEPLHVNLPQAIQAVVSTSSTHDYKIPPIVNGLAPVISSLPTKLPVIFLGIDDGVYKQPFELQIMSANQVKASLFLTNRFIKDNPAFFAPFMDEGSLIEDHTLDHKLLTNLTLQQQTDEICGEANLQTQQFGRRPILFRPPGGSYNTDTQKAAAVCGMKAVVLWIAKANGGSMQYQNGHVLHPGDIVLMHFRPEFHADMQAFLKAQNSAGLHTELLENWLD